MNPGSDGADTGSELSSPQHSALSCELQIDESLLHACNVQQSLFRSIAGKLRDLLRSNRELKSSNAELKGRLEGALRDQRRLVMEVSCSRTLAAEPAACAVCRQITHRESMCQTSVAPH